MDATTCLELALEGERLCKAGDCRAGVAFFEAAIQTGTDDLRTLSAIYSQLGNAYFYLGDYDKAMDYHKLDLTVAKWVKLRTTFTGVLMMMMQLLSWVLPSLRKLLLVVL